MQITDWVLSKIEKSEQPEEIARQLASRRIAMPQWEILIQKAKEMSGSPDVRAYLLTLFYASRVENDWLWLRVLGIIAQERAFDQRERQNALTSIEKKLDRLEKSQQTNPDAEAAAQISEYNAYLLVLKGSLRAENGEIAQAKVLFRQARDLYQELNNTTFVSWLDAQLQKLANPPAAQEAPQPTSTTQARPVVHLNLSKEHQPQTQDEVVQTQPKPQPVDDNIRRLQDQLAERDRKLSILGNLEKEMASMRQQNTKLRADLQVRSQELEALRKTQIQPDVRERTEETELRQELENKDGEIEDLRDTLRRKDQKIIDLQRDLQASHDQIGQLRRQIQLNQEKIRQLESDLEDSSGS